MKSKTNILLLTILILIPLLFFVVTQINNFVNQQPGNEAIVPVPTEVLESLVPEVTALNLTLTPEQILFDEINTPENLEFDGGRAYKDVAYQLSLPPRIPGSKSHEIVRKWIIRELENYGWDTQIQTDRYHDEIIYNLIANKNQNSPYILIGAHYDSRSIADHDPDPAVRNQGVPGANDGASGVSVLLELARTIPAESRKNIWLVFFDAEDQGKIDDWDWIVGSTSFVKNVRPLPDKVIIVDMIGDTDLQVYFEANSDPILKDELWKLAADLGYQEIFINQVKYAILDDHTPFIAQGIQSVDIIDFDYEYWHTTHDTLDKVSPESLAAVGDLLLSWIKY